MFVLVLCVSVRDGTNRDRHGVKQLGFADFPFSSWNKGCSMVAGGVVSLLILICEKTL